MKEVKLPSGAILKVQLAPFEDSKALYQAMLEESKGLLMDPQAQVDVNLYKNIFCVAFSSKRIEACVWKCMERALYNDLKMTKDTFEPAEAREDYLQVMFEVAVENVSPFTKSLYAQFSQILAMLPSTPA